MKVLTCRSRFSHEAMLDVKQLPKKLGRRSIAMVVSLHEAPNTQEDQHVEPARQRLRGGSSLMIQASMPCLLALAFHQNRPWGIRQVNNGYESCVILVSEPHVAHVMRKPRGF